MKSTLLVTTLFIRNLLNTPTKDHKMNVMIFDHNKDDEASKNENFSTSIEENRSDSPKKAFSALAERIDNLQNFFVFQI